MKANRKFISGDDEAVSPVIAVILMVAITVVLAATVYVWVSGFGAQSSSPAKTLSLTSSGAIDDGATNTTAKTYTVASATPGMKWSDLAMTLNGADLDYQAAFDADESGWQVSSDGSAIAEGDLDSTSVTAGQELTIQYAGEISGRTLRVLDSQANSVVLTLTIG